MKRKLIRFIKSIAILALFLMTFVTKTNVLAAENEQQELVVQSVKYLVITLPENLDMSVIDMYENGGWDYNPSTNQLEKPVTYKDLEIEVEGKVYKTDENGIVKVPVKGAKGKNIEIKSEQLTASGKNTKKEGGKLKTVVNVEVSNKPSIVGEYVNLNHILNEMGAETSNDTTQNKAESNEQVGEIKATAPYLDNGQLPYNGRAIHCNRFNGYTGDGRYYSDETSWAAIRNFFQSDCDVALARSTNCLADYGSNPYCAASPSYKNGHCGRIVGHDNTYHKHTGWFSPTT